MNRLPLRGRGFRVATLGITRGGPMPANLSHDYKNAEKQYRRASDSTDRLTALREMLRTIPKHKGTDHLQADIKTRIKEITSDLATGKKAGGRGGPPTVIRPEGAAQVGLIGPPNSGKSALHTRLTGSHAEATPYPFATQYPLPGMLDVDDTAIQLVDLPSISTRHPIPWIGNALQPADAGLLVINLAAAGCVEAVVQLHETLAQRRVVLTEQWPSQGWSPPDDPFTTLLPTAIVATHHDLINDIGGELAALRDLTGIGYPSLAVSVETGSGLDTVGPWLFEHLAIIRIYTKIPGNPPDMTRPYTVRRGATVHDVAAMVHKDVATNLRYARLWEGDTFDGRQVGRDHPVVDSDVVELHV